MNGVQEEELKTKVICGLEAVFRENDTGVKLILATSASTWNTVEDLFELMNDRVDDGELRNMYTVHTIRNFTNRYKREYRKRFAKIYGDRCVALMSAARYAGRGGANGATKDVMRIIARVVYSMRDL